MDKKRLLRQITELLRYSVAGGTAFVLELITKTLLLYFLPENMGMFSIFGFLNEVRVTVATTLGFAVGFTTNYIISIFFVFTSESQKKRGKGIKPFLIYLAVSLVGLLVNIGVTQFCRNLVPTIKDELLVGLAISCVAAGIALIWNYIGRKIFVYRGE